MNDISLCIYSHQELRIKARQDSDMAGLQEEGGGGRPPFWSERNFTRLIL